MRNIYQSIALASAIMAIAAPARADEPDADEGIALLTFEDADFKGDLEKITYKTEGMTKDNYWSSLIDSKQYEGPLLYPDDEVLYQWYDNGNTGISGGLTNGYFDFKFWGGGSVISNYFADSYAEATYKEQLEAYAPDSEGGGYGESANFLVVNGFAEEGGYSDTRAVLAFDNEAGEPLYAYANLGTYSLCTAFLGGFSCPAVAEGDYFEAVAEALDADGEVTNTTALRLIDGPDKITTEWTKWDLSPLGECAKIRFNIKSNMNNDYGLAFPAYFLLDNIAVKDKTNGISGIEADRVAPEGIFTITGIRVEKVTTPGIYIINGKKVYARP